MARRVEEDGKLNIVKRGGKQMVQMAIEDVIGRLRQLQHGQRGVALMTGALSRLDDKNAEEEEDGYHSSEEEEGMNTSTPFSMRVVHASQTQRQWRADSYTSAISSHCTGDVGALPRATRSSMVAHSFFMSLPSLRCFFATDFANT